MSTSQSFDLSPLNVSLRSEVPNGVTPAKSWTCYLCKRVFKTFNQHGNPVMEEQQNCSRSLADVDADRWFSLTGKGHFYWFGDPEANWTNWEDWKDEWIE